jgi:putative flippase GtrA
VGGDGEVVDVNRTIAQQRYWQAQRVALQSGRWSRQASLIAAVIAERARPLRFALVGGLCGAVQLGLLSLFLWGGAHALPANAIAFLFSAQLNFALGTFFTWHDRRLAAPGRWLIRRWLAFHGSIGATAVLNQLMFALARVVVPELVASALGIGAGAAANFLIQDRLVFRRPRSLHPGDVRPRAQSSPVVRESVARGRTNRRRDDDTVRTSAGDTNSGR